MSQFGSDGITAEEDFSKRESFAHLFKKHLLSINPVQ